MKVVSVDDRRSALVNSAACERRHGIIRILVADSFLPWHSFVKSLVEEKPGWHVICEVSNGLEAVQKAKELTPDVILLDIGLPGLSGIEAARQIRKVAPEVKILFLTTYDSVECVVAALGTGARGYVLKASAGSELVRAIEAIFDNKRFLSARLTGLTPGWRRG